MTDEIERVREVYKATMREYYGVTLVGWDDGFISLLAKRLQPKSTPAPKVWSVSAGTADKLVKTIYSPNSDGSWPQILNAIVDDILRDRPDAVAKEYQRRYRAAFGVEPSLKALFPEVEG